MGPEFDSQFEIVPTFSRTCNAQIEGLGWSQTSGGGGGYGNSQVSLYNRFPLSSGLPATPLCG